MSNVTELHRPGFQQSFPVGTHVNPYTPVKIVGSNAAFVVPAATSTDRPFGFSRQATAIASSATDLDVNDQLTVYEEGNVVKAIAAASLGAGAEVKVASTNGALGPAAVASGHWGVGIALSPAAAGERFSLYIKARRVEA